MSRAIILSDENTLEALPICDVCKKPVDKLVWMDDAFMERRSYRVFCHGDMQTVHVEIRELEHSSGAITFGRAFVRETAEIGEPRRLGP